MGQILVRNIDEDLKERLKRRAAKHGVSMEEEVRTILRTSLLTDAAPQYGLGTEIANLFRNIPDNDEPFEWEMREPLRPAKFDE